MILSAISIFMLNGNQVYPGNDINIGRPDLFIDKGIARALIPDRRLRILDDHEDEAEEQTRRVLAEVRK